MSGAAQQSWGEYLTGSGQGREKGARRQKLAGYLKAANEIRQSYTESIRQRNGPPVEWVMTGEEQLILFPSYAKWKTPRRRLTTTSVVGEEGHSDYGFDSTDDGNDGIIDVDVRGWLFKPQSGPLTRKNRILMEIARRLCGLPPLPAEGDDGEAISEQEIEKEAQKLTSDTNGSGSSTPLQSNSGASTPVPHQGSGNWSIASKPVVRQATAAISAWRNPYATSNSIPVPSAQTAEEHAELLARLTPFMHQPLPNQLISVFIYNEKTSTSRRIETCERGHFSLRASVDFVPTDIRVFVSDKLSMSEPVKLLEKNGVSLISDIDDTIKHSAVHAGTREMFRNTFIKPLDDLVIEGVKDWYNSLAASPYNVQIHYVSNSPWQLYPLLEDYVKRTGMPPGSFHLKQYSGMLKGIFEPVSERKKSSLERLIRDFPDRKWILVGDSGEMDLEVYSEIALTFPGRIKGIFIRDVLATSAAKVEGLLDAAITEMDPSKKTFFSQSVSDPALRDDYLPHPPPLPRRSFTTDLGADGRKPPPPPPKPRDLQAPAIPPKPRQLQNARPDANPYAPLAQPRPPPAPSRTNTGSSFSSFNSDGSRINQAVMPGGPPVATTSAERKLEVWNRRWAYARAALEKNGVILKTWKVGSDVKEECLEIVARELRR